MVKNNLYDIRTSISLNNGVAMPLLGLGVWEMAQGRETEAAIGAALDLGYRLIDTAKLYGNEASVGRAVRRAVEGGIRRDALFVTTKLWPTDFLHPEKAFRRSLGELGIDAVDLYLIHWPVPIMPKSVWQSLEKLYEADLTRAIGVSNYGIRDIEKLLSYARVPPAVNQIKFSVFDHDLELLEYCQSKNIAVEAYSPLERGRGLHNERLVRIADAHHKSSAQIMIRWALEHDTIVIPKSSNPARIRENADVFDFELTEEEMRELDALS